MVVVGHAFKSRIHKVAVKPPNIIEWVAGVELCTPFLLKVCPDGTVNTTFS